MPTLDSILEELLELMGNLHANIPKTFKPGLDRPTIVDAFQSIDFDPPEELITLYQWRNGLDDSLALKLEMEHEILPGSYFLSLEDAIAQHASNETWREAGEPLWESFRILSDHSNGGYSVAGKASGGKVIERCLHEPWAVAFASISTLFQLSAECYKKDVYHVDDMFLEADWDLFESLEQKFKVG